MGDVSPPGKKLRRSARLSNTLAVSAAPRVVVTPCHTPSPPRLESKEVLDSDRAGKRFPPFPRPEDYRINNLLVASSTNRNREGSVLGADKRSLAIHSPKVICTAQPHHFLLPDPNTNVSQMPLNSYRLMFHMMFALDWYEISPILKGYAR